MHGSRFFLGDRYTQGAVIPWGRFTYPLGLTSSDGHRNIYGWQASYCDDVLFILLFEGHQFFLDDH